MDNDDAAQSLPASCRARLSWSSASSSAFNFSSFTRCHSSSCCCFFIFFYRIIRRVCGFQGVDPILFDSRHTQRASQPAIMYLRLLQLPLELFFRPLGLIQSGGHPSAAAAGPQGVDACWNRTERRPSCADVVGGQDVLGSTATRLHGWIAAITTGCRRSIASSSSNTHHNTTMLPVLSSERVR